MMGQYHLQGGAQQRQPGPVYGPTEDAGAEEILATPLRNELQQSFRFSCFCSFGLSDDISVAYSLLIFVLPPLLFILVRGPGLRGLLPPGPTPEFNNVVRDAPTPTPGLQDLSPNVTLAGEKELFQGERGVEDRE